LINKFDAFLERLAGRDDAQVVFGQVVDAIANERGDAVFWASLLTAAANHPDTFAEFYLS
jgi:hypothetical protein